MRGIVLAGGEGSRLAPTTVAICKQLLPIYDKPLIYYPVSVLMLAGIRDILLICDPRWRPAFHRLFGDGSRLGLQISYAEQDKPCGIADAFRIGADFVGDQPVALVLGDNLFYGHGLRGLLVDAVAKLSGPIDVTADPTGPTDATADPTGPPTMAGADPGWEPGCVLFGHEVPDPTRFGVAEIDPDGSILGIEEKPTNPRSPLAVTGLYLYDHSVVEVAAGLAPSARGELEITDVNNHYVRSGRATLVDLGRGTAWLDTGTPDSLLEASQFVHVLERQQGVRVACLEEIALRMGFIDRAQAVALGTALLPSSYGEYVLAVAAQHVANDATRSVG